MPLFFFRLQLDMAGAHLIIFSHRPNLIIVFTATGSIIFKIVLVGVVIYTGTDTRSVMNTTKPKNKFGLLDSEVNFLTKILGLLLVSLAFVLMILQVRVETRRC